MPVQRASEARAPERFPVYQFSLPRATLPIYKRSIDLGEIASCVLKKSLKAVITTAFYYASAFNQPLADWDVSSVKSLYESEPRLLF